MTAPYVLPKNLGTSVIGSSETTIFTSQFVSYLDSIQIVNTFQSPILVQLLLKKAIGAELKTFIFRNWFVVDALSFKEILNEITFAIEPTDVLVALGKKENYTFDCIISYRELTELPIV